MPTNFVLALTPQSRAASSAKVSSQSFATNSKVISAYFLHFKPIFDSLLKKVVKRPPFLVASALVKLGHSLAGVKIWGRSTF